MAGVSGWYITSPSAACHPLLRSRWRGAPRAGDAAVAQQLRPDHDPRGPHEWEAADPSPGGSVPGSWAMPVVVPTVYEGRLSSLLAIKLDQKLQLNSVVHFFQICQKYNFFLKKQIFFDDSSPGRTSHNSSQNSPCTVVEAAEFDVLFLPKWRPTLTGCGRCGGIGRPSGPWPSHLPGAGHCGQCQLLGGGN